MSDFFFADADSSYSDAYFVIFGAPFDGTSTFRKGSCLAPDAVREVSYNYETYNAFFDVDLTDIPFHDAGNIDIHGDWTVDKVLLAVGNMASRILTDGKIPVMLGGEHSLTLPCIKESKIRYRDLGAVVMDAHFDLRDEYMGEINSHACISRRIIEEVTQNYISIGIRSGSQKEYALARGKNITCYPADYIINTGIDNIITEVISHLNSRHIYLSLDMDVLDPSFAPGLGTPEPFGITDRHVLSLIRSLAPISVGFDVMEIAPPFDCGNTALLGAKYVSEFIAAVWASWQSHI
jgi:agmatinase